MFVAIATLLSYPGFACDCGRGAISVKDFNSSDWIFIGTLLSERKTHSQFQRVCTYKVITAYKGVAPEDTIQVYDSEDVGSCGLGSLTIGGDYLMYASGNAEKWTSRCLGNSRVPLFILPRDSMAISHIRAVTYRGGIDDTVNTTFHTDTLFLSAHISKVRTNSFQKFKDRNGTISAEGRYNQRVQDGFWRYYEQGELVEYGRYLNGKKDSLWVRQYGTSKDIEEFRDGEFTYRQTTFYDGKIDSKSEPSVDGKKWIEYKYHDNGRPRYIANANPPERNEKGRLKNPVWDGPFKSFNEAGIVLDEGQHKSGLSVGHWKYFYENGKPRMEGDYVEGKKSGTWKIYYPGKKIKATGTYENGEKVGEWKYYNLKGEPIAPDPELIKDDEDWFTYTGVKK